MNRPNDATLAQISAADPTSSTWVSANAGSGKTRVLTDRVARLLLRKVPPEKILCLTYTKAAAANMQIKLFERLGEWAMLGDQALAARLAGLGESPAKLTPEFLRNARTLFARALETPGGLKIQTIHSFCASLLRRFPLEAGVSPNFQEMDDRSAKKLRAQVLEQIADGPDGSSLEALAGLLGGTSIDDILKEVIQHRDDLAKPLSKTEIWKKFELPDDYDEECWLDEVWPENLFSLIESLRKALSLGTATDNKNADLLAGLDWQARSREKALLLETMFVYGDNTKQPGQPKFDRFPTKKLRTDHPDLINLLHPVMQGFADARQRRLGLEAARAAHALRQFSAPFLCEFERLKQAQGWLDFDDLIMKARDLLSTSSMAQWVLFRLDGGIDHILVDEAQDTSPLQWEVIALLEQEFTAGRSARDVERTIFVVGDEKQSIYSFQGADPAAFDRFREMFQKRLSAIGKALMRQNLLYSFRSSSAILRVVDHVLEDPHSVGLAIEKVTHRTYHNDLPGRVDIWPFIDPPEKPEAGRWDEPLDAPAPSDPTHVLAGQIADAIKALLDAGETLPTTAGTRPLQAGDFIILVQKRSNLFHEIIKALKDRKLPVAGADRLKIGAVLAVKDLVALLSFLSTPEDDLSLACALRSPLFGLTERDLFSLAHERKGYLWPELRNRKADYRQAYEIIDDLLDKVDFLRPYELLERILTHHDGRSNLIARLGSEAEDGIDALLNQAMQYEQMEPPTLTGFLGWVSTDESDIKRQMDSHGNEIRVMTVHGAKGLEAPVVILPDTAQQRDGNHQHLIALDDGFTAWKLPETAAPARMRERILAKKAFAAQERMRLFYVAMTRAENWLIVCGAGTRPKEGTCWYDLAKAASLEAGAAKVDFLGREILRHEPLGWAQGGTCTSPAEQPRISLPEWAGRKAPQAERPPVMLKPSDLGGDKIIANATQGNDEQAAMLRGSRIHLLLEHLPGVDKAMRKQVATRLLPTSDDAAGIQDIDALLAKVGAILDSPDLAFLFASNSLAEVPVTARINDRPLYGIIDRLIVDDERILAIDYKTNVAIPETPEQVPEGILRQMGAYAEALEQIYPGRLVETAILWTEAPLLMMLPRQVVAGALARAAAS